MTANSQIRTDPGCSFDLSGQSRAECAESSQAARVYNVSIATRTKPIIIMCGMRGFAGRRRTAALDGSAAHRRLPRDRQLAVPRLRLCCAQWLDGAHVRCRGTLRGSSGWEVFHDRGLIGVGVEECLHRGSLREKHYEILTRNYYDYTGAPPQEGSRDPSNNFGVGYRPLQ